MSSVIESVNEQLFKHYDKESKTAVIKSEKMSKIFKKIGNIPSKSHPEYLDEVFEVFKQAGWKIRVETFEENTEPEIYIFEADTETN